MLRTVEASTYLKVRPRLVFSILTSYELYRDWVPDIVESQVFAREGEVAIAQFISPQYGDQKFVLEFIESADDWLIYNQVDRYRQRGLSGRWDLEEVDGGDGVVVRGAMSLRTGLLRLRSRGRMRRVLDRTMEALATRSLRLAARGATSGGGEREKILEIIRTADALEVRLDGEVFDLTRRRREGWS